MENPNNAAPVETKAPYLLPYTNSLGKKYRHVEHFKGDVFALEDTQREQRHLHIHEGEYVNSAEFLRNYIANNLLALANSIKANAASNKSGEPVSVEASADGEPKEVALWNEGDSELDIYLTGEMSGVSLSHTVVDSCAGHIKDYLEGYCDYIPLNCHVSTPISAYLGIEIDAICDSD